MGKQRVRYQEYRCLSGDRVWGWGHKLDLGVLTKVKDIWKSLNLLFFKTVKIQLKVVSREASYTQKPQVIKQKSHHQMWDLCNYGLLIRVAPKTIKKHHRQLLCCWLLLLLRTANILVAGNREIKEEMTQKIPFGQLLSQFWKCYLCEMLVIKNHLKYHTYVSTIKYNISLVGKMCPLTSQWHGCYLGNQWLSD